MNSYALIFIKISFTCKKMHFPFLLAAIFFLFKQQCVGVQLVMSSDELLAVHCISFMQKKVVVTGRSNKKYKQI